MRPLRGQRVLPLAHALACVALKIIIIIIITITLVVVVVVVVSVLPLAPVEGEVPDRHAA